MSSRETGSAAPLVLVIVVVVAVAFAGAAYAGVLPWGETGTQMSASKPAQGTPRSAPEAGESPPAETTAPLPHLNLPDVPQSANVLPRLSATKNPPSAQRIKQRVRPILRDPAMGRVAFAVAELGSDDILWRFDGPSTVTPASTTKLLTTTAALATLGPQHRFTTKVVAGQGKHPHTVVLVGGGDPLLAVKTTNGQDTPYPEPATLHDLAAQTADALKKQGIQRVRVNYDASLFTGPAVNPTWESQYIPTNVVSPISALWVNEGRAQAGYAARVDDPAEYAAKQFVDQLTNSGITVTAKPKASQAPAHGQVLGHVESPTLGQITQHILRVSDNEGAEVLLRQLAIATGRPGSFQAGTTAVTHTLADLGIDMSGVQLYDGSGLSRHNRIPVRVLMQVLQLAASPSQPTLRPVVSGLPVAGFNGSLSYRYDDAPAGRGVVRAKTGTLTGVHALAGIALTEDGHALVFVAVANKVKVPKTLQARADLARITAELAECGC